MAAIKSYMSRVAAQGLLEFYLDLHAHANKRGVFAYGNALKGTEHIETLTFCRWDALHSDAWLRVPSLHVRAELCGSSVIVWRNVVRCLPESVAACKGFH